MDLRLPLDFERRPECWALTGELRVQAGRSGRVSSDAAIDQMACLLWLRLWVVLGYLAGATDRPGWLTDEGALQVNGAFGPQFGEEVTPVAVLVQSGLLRRTDGELHCPLFARTNPHLAGNFLSPTARANLRSVVVRGAAGIAAQAPKQALLLPEGYFRTRDGVEMTAAEVNRAMVLILTLDRCLKARARSAGNYSAGLMADAHAAAEATPAGALKAFYFWLAENARHPAVPKAADLILRDWTGLIRLAGSP